MPTLRKLGKKPPRVDRRTLKLGKYLTAALPPAPTRCDWSRGFNINYGMMLNDSLGCCVEAAKGHAEQIWTLCNGRLVTAPEANGGYVPGNPSTDNGEVELDSLNAWQKNASGLSPISAFAAIDYTTQFQVQQAIHLFGLAFIGFQVPQSAMDQNAAGQIWDVVANDGGIVGGHAVAVPMYDVQQNILTCITWYERQIMTWAFFNRYIDEAYAILSPAWLARNNVSPAGFDMAALQSDLAQVTA
jgi:hypothetical protein